MSIQSSINQARNLGGLLYTQTGGYKAKQEEIFKKKEVTKAEEAVQKNAKVALEAVIGAAGPEASQAARNIATETLKDTADATKKLYKLDPTKENLARATRAGGMVEAMQEKYKTVPYDPNKAKDANKKAADRVNAMSEQKESAKRYMMLLKEDKE